MSIGAGVVENCWASWNSAVKSRMDRCTVRARVATREKTRHTVTAWTTLAMPSIRARGIFRPGSRISSPRLDALTQPS